MDLINKIRIDNFQEAENILKAAGSEELLEKAHQDGDIHPKHPDWVWVSSASGGKGDWRKLNGRIHKKHSDTQASNKKQENNNKTNHPQGGTKSKTNNVPNSNNKPSNFLPDPPKDSATSWDKAVYQMACAIIDGNGTIDQETNKKYIGLKRHWSEGQLKRIFDDAKPISDAAIKNSQKADFQVSKAADGKRFAFNYGGKEYQFDSKKNATELSALLSTTSNGKGIQKVFEYLSENFPNPISGMADNQLINLGYTLNDVHGNGQDQRSHRYDPINVANRVCESVMSGKEQFGNFLPDPIYLRHMDYGVKSLYDKYRRQYPTELAENKKRYEEMANNSMETATRKQSARQHLQAISLITNAYDKFFAQWND